MTKKISKIKFGDFASFDDFVNYLLQNGIDFLETSDGELIRFSHADEVWENNKPEDLKKFKS